jgi:hypothetical protein
LRCAWSTLGTDHALGTHLELQILQPLQSQLHGRRSERPRSRGRALASEPTGRRSLAVDELQV